MKKLVVVINGPGGVGKDTLIGAVAEKYKVDNFSSIDIIEGIAYQNGWWNGEKTNKARAFLHDLKTAFTKYNDLPMWCTLDRCESFLKNEYNNVMFVHIREPKEIARFVGLAPCKVVTLLVNGPLAQRSYGNDGDDQVRKFRYDLTYYNDLPIDQAEVDFVDWFDKWFSQYCFDSEEVC